VAEPLRILLIEDNPLDAELIQNRLAAKLDCSCTLVDTREKLLSALGNVRFDLVLCDYSIPSFDGLAALELVKEEFPDIPFIFVSGTIGEERAIESLKRGATDYILKDRAERLVPAVQRALKEVQERKERRRAQAELLRSQELFRLITENVYDLIAVLDLNGKRLYSSPSYESILGDPDNLMGTDSFLEIHPDDRERVRGVFAETVRTGIGRRSEFRFIAKDGSVRYVESHGSVIKNPRGDVEKVVVVSRDVSERKRFEEELRQAQKMESIGVLAGGIAHDFNNILAIILGYISMLQRGHVPAEKVPKSYEAIHKAVLRGSGLVSQLLTFARKSDVQLEPVKVDSILRELLKMLEATFPKTIRISVDSRPALPGILADAGQLHQALLNLSVNARDAMPKGGSLTFRTGVQKRSLLEGRFADAIAEEYVFITVKDTGTGIQKETLSKIFDPFFTTKEKGKGTGLGLAVVYGFVRSHYGFVDVETEMGKGTAFTLYLPTHTGETEMKESADLPAADVKGGSETILLVEDEEMLVDLVKTLLEIKGYRVLVAHDGFEAVEVYRNNMDEVALVLSDVDLPRLSGWDAYLKMKELNPQVRIVFASGYLEEESKAEYLRGGVLRILQKPYMPAEVLRSIREGIDKK